jgi:hypothetical protein
MKVGRNGETFSTSQIGNESKTQSITFHVIFLWKSMTVTERHLVPTSVKSKISPFMRKTLFISYIYLIKVKAHLNDGELKNHTILMSLGISRN